MAAPQPAPSSRAQSSRAARLWYQGEHTAAVLIMAAMVVLPVIATVARWTTGQSWAGLGLYVQSLNLWVAFTGAAIAARTGRHLALSTGAILQITGRPAALIKGFTAAVAAAVTGLLAYAGVGLVLAERASSITLSGGIPNWLVQAVIPAGFAVMAVRFAWFDTVVPGRKATAGRTVAILAIGLAFATGLLPEGSREPAVWIGGGIILTAVALGAPLFTAMGGMAMLLFFGNAIPVPIVAVPAETYRIVASPTLPTIPLFTLAGYLLAEGGASKRLVALFQAWVGWIPGGTAGATVLVCAFFTTFTGASGVTILALGGLLLPVLLKSGYDERFSIGLIAAAGSIGLLFPPSLPVILYGVVSHVPIDDLYMAGVVPGIVLVGLLVGWGLYQGIRQKTKREAFDAPTAWKALWGARWEAAIPLLVVGGIFGGFMTVTEAAAFTAFYAFFIEVIVHRTLDIRRDLPRVVVESVTLVGGVLIILGVALGFTSYLVDAEIPMKVTHWVQGHVANKYTFILLLNVFLLGVGCLMDVFSAIMVVVPLIVPIGLAFGINPLHLGILFLANLELGYLTPPVGLNLFLASYRFNKPLTAVYRMAVPFLIILTVGVLFIAYVPGMTTWAGDEPVDVPEFHTPEKDQKIEIPQGVDLMQELNDDIEDEASQGTTNPDTATPDAATQPGGGHTTLVIPQGVDLMKELDEAVEEDDANTGGASNDAATP